MDWWDERFTTLDLETTSADPSEARIVSAAIVQTGGGQPTESWSWLLDPGVEIPEEAAGVHGITTERARAEGTPAVEGVRDILARLTVLRGFLVIFNARYDLTVADREARRHGTMPLLDRRAVDVFDPLVTDRWLDRYRPGSRKLQAICTHHKITLLEAHDADADALLTARLAWHLLHKGKVVRRARGAGELHELKLLEGEWIVARGSARAMHEATERWAVDQAWGLEAHFAKQGKPEVVAKEWPVIPVGVTGS